MTANSASLRIDLTEDLKDLGLTRTVVRPREALELVEQADRFLARTSESTPYLVSAVIPPEVIPVLRPAARFIVLQKWEGQVLTADASTFTAKLLDLTQGATEEIAEFDLEEVNDDDHELVGPGAVFYWSIGYRVEPSGERSRSSVMRFRRLPAWSENDVAAAKERAAELRRRLGL